MRARLRSLEGEGRAQEKAAGGGDLGEDVEEKRDTEM